MKTGVYLRLWPPPNDHDTANDAAGQQKSTTKVHRNKSPRRAHIQYSRTMWCPIFLGFRACYQTWLIKTISAQAITAQILSSQFFSRCKSVSCYLSMPTGEVDTGQLVSEILSAGTLESSRISVWAKGRRIRQNPIRPPHRLYACEPDEPSAGLRCWGLAEFTQRNMGNQRTECGMDGWQKNWWCAFCVDLLSFSPYAYTIGCQFWMTGVKD